MLSLSDLSETTVTLPLAQFQGEEEGGDFAGSSVRCTVLLFRTSAQHWLAITSLDAAPGDDRPAPPPPPRLDLSADLGGVLDTAAKSGLLFPVSPESFALGPRAAVSEALSMSQTPGATSAALASPAEDLRQMAWVAEQQRAARAADPGMMAATGDGAIFRPFRFPTKISEAFRLPWGDIGKVTDRQLESFWEGTQMRNTPKRVIGAVIYIHHHYLLPFKQKIISRGRHLLVIKISEGAGRHPTRRCVAWWMPLPEVRERYADPARADKYAHGGSVYRVCQLVETYKLSTTVPVHFEVGERPHLGVGGFPLHCFDAAPEFRTQWRIGATDQELEEERKEVDRCIESKSSLEMSGEAKKAEKRRRKRQNRKARDKERAAEDAKAADEEQIEERRRALVRPNVALQGGGFLDGVLEQMRQRKAGLSGTDTAGAFNPPRRSEAEDFGCDSESSVSSSGSDD